LGRRAKGFRHKTRSLLTRKPRERGKTGLTKILHEYAVGEKVVVKLDPSMHKGMPHRRFQGQVGLVSEKKGRAYVVKVPQGEATKEIIVRPEHLASYQTPTGAKKQ